MGERHRALQSAQSTGEGQDPSAHHRKTAEWVSAKKGFRINPPNEQVRAELERIALAPARSGRAALAKVTALRTLEKLARPVADESYPVDDDGRFLSGRRSCGISIAAIRMRRVTGGAAHGCGSAGVEAWGLVTVALPHGGVRSSSPELRPDEVHGPLRSSFAVVGVSEQRGKRQLFHRESLSYLRDRRPGHFRLNAEGLASLRKADRRVVGEAHPTRRSGRSWDQDDCLCWVRLHRGSRRRNHRPPCRL
jgi:hypothetical protein